MSELKLLLPTEENSKIQNLAISDDKIRNHYFFGSNELSDCYFIDKTKIDLSKLNFSQPSFSKIKNLLINGRFEFDGSILLNQLKYLKELECLELDCLEIKENENYENIECESLKYLKLYFGIDRSDESKVLVFNTPNLTNLRINLEEDSFKRIKFKHSNSIRYLETAEFDNQILEFTNLEVLYCVNSSNLKDIKLLTKLTKLKEIYLFDEESIMSNLIKEKDELKRDDLKLYYQYVKINNQDDFEKLIKLDDFNTQYLELKEFKHLYGNLDRLATTFPLFYGLDFNSIANSFENDNSFFEFINRFTSFFNLFILNNKIEYENKLNSLFRKYDRIIFLSCGFSGKDQEQQLFNRLPILCPKLDTLVINTQIKDNEIDLGFMLNFKNLVHFTLFSEKKQSTIEFLKLLFDRTNLFEFYGDIEKIGSITINHDDDGYFYIQYDKSKKMKSLDELYDIIKSDNL